MPYNKSKKTISAKISQQKKKMQSHPNIALSSRVKESQLDNDVSND